MNLFFIHTPFQLLVAQNLIRKKKLKNNIALLSNTGVNAEHFYKTFEIMMIEEIWLDSIILGDLNKGVYSFKSPISSYVDLYKFSKRISDIIKSNKIDSLYFGDINHPAYIFLAEKWQKRNKIYFFEEGLSHYNNPFFKKKFENSSILKFKKFMTDRLIFKSLGVSNFSKYLQAVEDVDFDHLIDKKYNILPTKKRKFEELVEFEIYHSKRFTSLLDKEFEQLNDEKRVGVLYLSSTASYMFSNPLEDEIEILNQLIQRLKMDKRTSEGFVLYIKFHPKDNEIKKKVILKALKKAKVDFYELSKDTAYPVEVLFNQIEIAMLFGFGSSSQLYAEVINPKIASYNLLYNLKVLYKIKNDNSTFPEKSWTNWETMFKNIFQKQPLKYNNQ